MLYFKSNKGLLFLMLSVSFGLSAQDEADHNNVEYVCESKSADESDSIGLHTKRGCCTEFGCICVSGSATIGGKLTANGSASVGNLNIRGGGSVGGNLSVGGNIILGGSIVNSSGTPVTTGGGFASFYTTYGTGGDLTSGTYPATTRIPYYHILGSSNSTIVPLQASPPYTDFTLVAAGTYAVAWNLVMTATSQTSVWIDGVEITGTVFGQNGAGLTSGIAYVTVTAGAHLSIRTATNSGGDTAIPANAGGGADTSALTIQFLG